MVPAIKSLFKKILSLVVNFLENIFPHLKIAFQPEV